VKVIIAGSRDCTDYVSLLIAIYLAKFEITEVVSGCARGVDKMGERWAQEHGIPIKRFPADWNKYGKGAGSRRNTQMAEHSEALIALWDGASSGTKNMIKQSKVRGLEVFVYRVKGLVRANGQKEVRCPERRQEGVPDTLR